MRNQIESRRPFRWWYAAIIFVVANLISALPAGWGGDEIFYNSFQQPALAPPDWLFPPMWIFLNVTSLMALYIVVNSPEQVLRRRVFFALEAFGWVLFAIFTTLYFGLNSPILGAIDTVTGLVVAFASLICCYPVSRKASLLILFRAFWLVLASYVSFYVALYNVDPFFQQMGN
ncbi:MAG: TspO/MBR family protein [Cyanobacteria bacterium P01_A01_bin.40]